MKNQTKIYRFETVSEEPIMKLMNIDEANKKVNHVFFTRILEYKELFSLKYETFEDDKDFDEDDVIIHKIKNSKVISLEIGEKLSSDELKNLINC